MDGSIFKNTRFLFILTTAFLSIMGIGLIIPVIPFIVEKYISTHNQDQIALHVGLLVSTYAFCQFFAAPILGAFSDKFGRRPILLVCQAGSAVGYILFGIGGALWVLYLGRIIDGLTGGDVSTVFSYVADVTRPQDRGKYYGTIGAVIGLGFMIGPTLGGLLSHFGLSAPLFFAAGTAILNMIFGFFVLPESLDKSHRMADFSVHHLNPFGQLQSILKQTNIRSLLTVGSFYYLPFAIMSAIMSVYLKDVIHWTPTNIGFYFLVLGIGDMITQGFLSGKLLPKFGEINLAVAGFFLTGAAFAFIALLPIFPFAAIVFIYIVAYALGSGLFEPSYSALVSHTAKPQEQGRIQGANQSMQSITRIIGPLLAAIAYGFSADIPFLIAAILSGVGMILLSHTRGKIKQVKL